MSFGGKREFKTIFRGRETVRKTERRSDRMTDRAKAGEK